MAIALAKPLMLTLQEDKHSGTFRVCLREAGRTHCTTVNSIKEAYAAQASLKRAIETGKMQILKWDSATCEWDGGEPA